MNYSPKQELKKTYFLSLCFMLPGILTFILAASSPATALVQAIGLALCSVGIFVMYRYALISFHYIIEDGELTVQKISGKRIITVARVPLSECESLTKLEKNTLKDRKFRGGKYRYTVNFPPKEQHLLVFRDGDDSTALILECEAEFAAALSALICG